MKIKYSILFILLFVIITIYFLADYIDKNKTKFLNSKVLLHNFQDNIKFKTILIFGQSNAANYSSKLNSTVHEIYTYYNGKILLAKDPLKGASGKKGSVWIPFSELIIEEDDIEAVLLVNIAEGSSTVFDWSNQGKYHKKLLNILLKLKKDQIIPNYILWQLGEQDNQIQTSTYNYKNYCKEILDVFRSNRLDSPILISITSYNPNAINPLNENIRNAQKEIIIENENVFSGPDTDKFIDIKDRYDGIHFSGFGNAKLANAWKEKVITLEK